MATAFLLDGGRLTAVSMPAPRPLLDDLAERLDIALPREVKPLPGVPAKRLGSRAMAQRRRRAVILAAARSLFSENGSRGITIRSLAARSGVTAPTIYKLVGGRGAVLEQALLEVLSACIEQAPVVAERCDINVISGFIETLWRATELHPAYSRHQIDLNWRTPGGRRVGTFFREGSIGTLTDWLETLCDASALARIGGARAVASAIESHLRITFIDWANGASSMVRLRRDLAVGTAIILTGLVDEDEAQRMHDWLARLNAVSEGR